MFFNRSTLHRTSLQQLIRGNALQCSPLTLFISSSFLRIRIKNAGGVILGLAAGFLISYLTNPNKWLQLKENSGSVFRENHNMDDFTVANQLRNEVKVLCLILTTANNHQTRALHVKNTWGRRCNKLLFMSDKEDKDLDTVGLNVTHDHAHLWGKTKLSFEYIYKYHVNDYDWFLKADDDTYVIVENLRYMLQRHSPESPIYFGNQFQITTPFHQIYMSGGAGYVLSREAVKRFVEKAIPNKKICVSGTEGPEDLILGFCLSNVNVTAVDTRDHMGRGTFFPFEPAAHLVPGSNIDPDYWYIKYSVHGVHYGLQCCSDNAISFHYVKPADMYLFDYLIYSLHPYGIIKYPQFPHKSAVEQNTTKS
ncbi:Glycoprotein-N-acetylgalactosamine 3-beta-galactosyltransferase 1 [Pseudolycoriella hygida]|uniref:Glycoprotein-N-acetylgalactosamine 3-beta-galactosyltransferase 1 n=1 Tax=Pseudolycoriella hygida TaxID=35572 RepID=A0A9Q0S181_9DIPT|nr:Glycoprotein-N-acetylgalactosamine 3-beta-galactosyltransferase 1 [Pseudolycoriella hygida]